MNASMNISNNSNGSHTSNNKLFLLHSSCLSTATWRETDEEEGRQGGEGSVVVWHVRHVDNRL